MAHRFTAGLLALILVLGAVACAQDEVLVDTPPAVSFVGSRWVVAAFALDGVGGILPAGAGLTLDFDDAGGVRGSAGCNSYSGQVSFAAGGIAITGLGSTEVACEPDVMEREARFLEALGRVSIFFLDADRLTLTAGDGSASIDLVAFVAEPDRALAGTTWVLATLIDGDVASSVVAGTSPRLAIDDKAATVTGDTGCNHFRGAVAFSDGDQAAGTMTVGAVSVTMSPCADPAVSGQEAFVFGVFGASVGTGAVLSWEIDGTLLRVTAAGGRALEYRAG